MSTLTASLDVFAGDELGRLGGCLIDQAFLEFAAIERADRAEPWYFYHKEHGKLVAFAPAFVHRGPIHFSFDAASFLAGEVLPVPCPREDQILQIGTPYRSRSDIAATSDSARRGLLESIIAKATNRRLELVAFPFVVESNRRLRECLLDKDFIPAFFDLDFFMNVQSEQFDQAFLHLSEGARKRLRNDRNHFTRSGLGIDCVKEMTPDLANRLAQVHQKLMQRHGHSSVELSAVSFSNIVALLRNSNFLVVTKSSEVGAYAWSTFDSTEYHCLRYAQDYDVCADSRVYFNLVFLRSLDAASSLGCKRISFGKAGHVAKALRGCEFEPAYAYFKFLDPSVHQQMRTVLGRVGQTRLARISSLLKAINVSV